MTVSLRGLSAQVGVEQDFAELYGVRPAGVGVAWRTVAHAKGADVAPPSMRELSQWLAGLVPITLDARVRVDHLRDVNRHELSLEIEASPGLVLRCAAYLVPVGGRIVLRGAGVTTPMWGERGPAAGLARTVRVLPDPGRYDLLIVRAGIEAAGPRVLTWQRFGVDIPSPSSVQRPPLPVPPVIDASGTVDDDGAIEVEIEGTGFLPDAVVAVRLVSQNDQPVSRLLPDYRSDARGALTAEVTIAAREWRFNSTGRLGVGVSATDDRHDPRTGDPLWSNVVPLWFTARQPKEDQRPPS